MTGTRKLPPTAELLELRRQGMTYTGIAERYDATAGAVYAAMRRAGQTNRQACPSCGVGTVHATFQVFISYPWVGEPPAPDTDFFVEASCDNAECADTLSGGGDGRLRRAGLFRDYDPVAGEDELEAEWIATVRRIIRQEEEPT